MVKEGVWERYVMVKEWWDGKRRGLREGWDGKGIVRWQKKGCGRGVGWERNGGMVKNGCGRGVGW